jgi:glutamate-ammonia-ligase adenylyltransferase
LRQECGAPFLFPVPDWSHGPLPHAWQGLPPESLTRLQRLAAASPLYLCTLLQQPAWALWLEEDRNLRADFRYGALNTEWQRHLAACGAGTPTGEARLAELRRWRRLMSLRIAYRSVNHLASETQTTAELTRLAEFCVRAVLEAALRRWTDRLGHPWSDELSSPARFCILALGKMGGEELNFSSDIDLIYVYEGDGYCRRGDVATSVSNVEFFTRVAETLTRHLSASTGDGFLFRVDARLRPEGGAGPLVRSLPSLENYYSVAGQTWERLAWLKARPVAGDTELGAELLESLHSFRYPRHPPPSLLAEIGAMKLRTEREIVGTETPERNVKLGRGGIREIEFIAQAFQVLHAGTYPFLQTHSTHSALEQLARYELISEEESAFLQQAYWELRRLEHRLQMREEQQAHTLPAPGEALDALALSLDFASTAEFQRHFSEIRSRVRALYDELFSAPAALSEADEWWAFFTGSKSTPSVVENKLQRWFGGEVTPADLRLFACGDATRMVTKEQVTRFQHLASSFDTWGPELARPQVTLRRLSRFAERYSSRSHFFGSCASNPQFLRVLALLFDRSTFIHELLCAHPEIFEEVLRPENLRLRKTADMLRAELQQGPPDMRAFSQWLTLYLRAEQVRHAIAHLLEFHDAATTEAALGDLADAALAEVLSRHGLPDRLLVVALGKYGGRELSPGSDLDLLFVAADGDTGDLERGLRSALQTLRGNDPLGPALLPDTRLRPHGEAGPLITTLGVLRRYHENEARLWERQLLTRARLVCGPGSLGSEWLSWRDEYVFGPGLSPAQLAEIWQMRLRIQDERDLTDPPQLAFKTGPGGLVDCEFFLQALQLRHGALAPPALRTGNTRQGLLELARLGHIPERTAEILLKNYEFIKRVEMALRQDANRPITVLPHDQTTLARWLGFPSPIEFWQVFTAAMAAIRSEVERQLFHA